DAREPTLVVVADLEAVAAALHEEVPIALEVHARAGLREPARLEVEVVERDAILGGHRGADLDGELAIAAPERAAVSLTEPEAVGVDADGLACAARRTARLVEQRPVAAVAGFEPLVELLAAQRANRSEEHTSELQSREN